MEVFQIKDEDNSENEFKKYNKKKNLLSASLTYNEKYNLIKKAEGEILLFYAKIAEGEIKKENLIHLNQLMASVRSAMYSAKGMKDINQDRKEFSNSGNDLKYDIYKLFRSKLSDFYKDLNEVFLSDNKSVCFEKLEILLAGINVDFQERMNSFNKNAGKEILKDVDISTLFNVNRELYSSSKAIIFSLKDYLLDTANAEKFENIPTSILK